MNAPTPVLWASLPRGSLTGPARFEPSCGEERMRAASGIPLPSLLASGTAGWLRPTGTHEQMSTPHLVVVEVVVVGVVVVSGCRARARRDRRGHLLVGGGDS